jgi:hypothetical protein
LSPFAHKKETTGRCSSVVNPLSTVAILTIQPTSEYAHARLLPRLSWSWTMLLPSDTHIENLLRPLQLFYFHLWLLARPWPSTLHTFMQRVNSRQVVAMVNRNCVMAINLTPTRLFYRHHEGR